MKTTLHLTASLLLCACAITAEVRAQQAVNHTATIQNASAAKSNSNPPRVPYEDSTANSTTGCDSTGGCCSSGNCGGACGNGRRSLFGGWSGLSRFRLRGGCGCSASGCDSGCAGGACNLGGGCGGCNSAACCGTGLAGGLSGFGFNGCRRSDRGCSSGCDSRGGGGLGFRGFGLMGLLGAQGCGTCSPCCGVYQNLFGGFSAPHNVNTSIAPDFDIDLHSGWLVGRAIGRQLNCCWRAEIETSFRNNSVARVIDAGVAGPEIGGRANVTAGMLNIVRDLPPRGACNDIRPYAGIGGGVAYVNFEADDPVTGFYDARGTTGAYQVFVGTSKRVRQSMDVYGEYRFFGTDNFAVSVTDPNGGAGIIEANLAQHNFIFGVRLWTR